MLYLTLPTPLSWCCNYPYFIGEEIEAESGFKLLILSHSDWRSLRRQHDFFPRPEAVTVIKNLRDAPFQTMSSPERKVGKRKKLEVQNHRATDIGQ